MSYPAPSRSTALGSHPVTVLSLNLAKETDIGRIEQPFSQIRPLQRADILLLQEVETPPEAGKSAAQELAQLLGFGFVYAPVNVWENQGVEGLAIVSRYPLDEARVVRLTRFDLRFNNRCRVALTATARTPIGPVRLFNVHLDSRINSGERLEQLKPVLEEARRASGLCLVAGDFNTSDLYWLGRVLPIPFKSQETVVRRSLEEAGFLTPFVEGEATFDYLALRLDSIYVRDLDWTEFGIEEIEFSDHRALWITVKPR